MPCNDRDESACPSSSLIRGLQKPQYSLSTGHATAPAVDIYSNWLAIFVAKSDNFWSDTLDQRLVDKTQNVNGAGGIGPEVWIGNNQEFPTSTLSGVIPAGPFFA